MMLMMMAMMVIMMIYSYTRMYICMNGTQYTHTLMGRCPMGFCVLTERFHEEDHSKKKKKKSCLNKYLIKTFLYINNLVLPQIQKTPKLNSLSLLSMNIYYKSRLQRMVQTFITIHYCISRVNIFNL